jgi:hypothetical protein
MAKRITFDDVYNYAISRKLTHNQALGLAQNVESESGFDPTVVNEIGATGLFQHLGSRKEKLLRFVQGDLSNWRKQIDFALMEPDARNFLATDFKDPYEATAHFTEKFERPENAKQKGKERAAALAARLSGKKQPVQKATSPESPVFDPGGVLAYDQMAGANAIRKSETPAFEPPAPDPSLPLPKVFQTDTPESYNYAGDPDELRKYVRSEGIERAMAMTRDFEWSMNTVWGTSPDEAAKVKQIAKGSGIPEDMVRTDPAEWAKWDNARKTFDRVTARNSDGSLRHPAVVNWLRNPDNLEQAQDDIDWLAQVNEGIRKAKLLGESVGETALRDLNYGTTQVVGSMANLPGTVARAMYEGVVAPNVNAAAKLAIRKEVLSSVAPKFLTKNPLTRFFDSWADYYKAPDPDMASPFMQLAAGDAAAVMPLTYNTFRVAVQNIPQLVALAAGSSAKAAQGVGTLAKVETLNFAYPLMFGMVFEDVYNRSRLEGKDPFSSLVSAIGQGTVEVGTEMMGTGKLIDEIVGGTAETGARAIAKGTATQFIEEFMASAGSTGFEVITGSEVGLGEAAVQATTEGLVGGMTGASLTSLNTVRVFAARQAARSPEASAVMRQNAKLSEIVDQRAQHQQAFNDIRQGIQNSKTNLRNEDAAEDFISESLRENKQDEYLYVDAEALFTAFQERMPPEQEDEIWRYFGLDKETIDHARKVEGEVPIKKATATQAEIKFGLEGIWDELAPMTKYFADDVTDPEIEAEMRNLAEMNKALRQKLDEIKEQTILPESMKQIRKTLIESRAMNAEEADANMLVAMAGLNVLAKHFGVDLETYANETLGLTVELNPGTERQGMVEMFGGGTKITLYKGAKRDTFLHEMAHVFESEIRKLSQNGVKNPEFAAQAAQILESTKNDPEGFVKLFTAYLSEGKAPAVAMDEAFSLFRKWVQQIYRAVDTGLGVQLDDDARGFFDALLASESDIEQAKLFYEQVEAFQEYFAGPEAAGAEEGEAKPKKEKAEKTALQIQTEKRLAAYYRAIGGKAEVRNSVIKKLDDMEVYIAMTYARNTGGLREMDLLSLGVSKEIVASIRGKHPGLFHTAKNESNAKKYTSVISMAAEAGYGSVEEMVAELANALPKQEAIKQGYEKEQARIQDEIVRGVLKSDTGATNADEAMHNEDYGAALIAETQEIAEKLEREQKAAVRKVEKQAMEAWAKRQARVLPVSMATRAKTHLRKESSYAKKAVEAMKQGNFSAAYDAMMGRLREHFAVKEAIDLLRWSERFANRYTASRVTERLRPKGKRGVVNEYEQMIFALMSEYRVGARIDKEGNVVFSEKIAPKKSWAEVRTQIDPTILEYFPDWVIRGEKPDGFKTWKDLTVEQAKDLEAALGQLEAFGSDLLKSEIFGEMKTVQEALDAAKESMSHLRRKKTFNRNTLLGQIQAKIDRSFIPWIAKFEVLFERLDNYSVLKGMTFGVHRRIFNGAIAAEATRHELVTSTVKNAGTAHEVLARAQKRLDKLFGTRISAGKNPLTSLLKPELVIPNLPFPQILAKAYGQNGWTSHQLVSLLMNAGNNSNWQVTKDGYNFPDGARDTLFSLFTKEELQAAQQLGDATESLYEYTNETYKKLSHRDLTKVEAEGITVITADGERVELRGWYHPLKYDRKVTGDTFKEEDFLKQEMDAVLYRITPDSGFTKIRKSNVSLAPLLDMKVWYDHIDRASIFASSAVLLRDAARIFGNKAWQSELTEVLGAEGAEATKSELIKWMADLARPYSPKMQDNFVSKPLYKAHRRGVAVTLFLNIPVAATQRLGIVNALSALGQDGKGSLRYFLEASKEVSLRDHILGEKKSELWNRLLSISPQLRIREDHMNQLIRDAKLEMKGDGKSISFFGRSVTMGEIREFGFELLRMQDRALIMPVYLAAMKKYLDNHLEGEFNERQAGAVAYADSLVRAHQPASAVAEMTAFERDGGWIRIFMAFMSFSATFGGRMQQTFEAWRDGVLPTKKMAQFVFLEIVLASEIYNLLQYALRFDWPEDLWEFLGDAVRAPLDMLLSPIPIARGIPRAIAEGMSGRSLLGDAPAGRALDQGVISPLVSTKKLLQGEQDFEVWLYDMAKAVEIYYGIPAFTFVENTVKTYNKAIEQFSGD